MRACPANAHAWAAFLRNHCEHCASSALTCGRCSDSLWPTASRFKALASSCFGERRACGGPSVLATTMRPDLAAGLTKLGFEQRRQRCGIKFFQSGTTRGTHTRRTKISWLFFPQSRLAQAFHMPSRATHLRFPQSPRAHRRTHPGSGCLEQLYDLIRDTARKPGRQTVGRTSQWHIPVVQHGC